VFGTRRHRPTVRPFAGHGGKKLAGSGHPPNGRRVPGLLGTWVMLVTVGWLAPAGVVQFQCHYFCLLLQDFILILRYPLACIDLVCPRWVPHFWLFLDSGSLRGSALNSAKYLDKLNLQTSYHTSHNWCRSARLRYGLPELIVNRREGGSDLKSVTWVAPEADKPADTYICCGRLRNWCPRSVYSESKEGLSR
jgi:hypothetical protein